MADSLANVKRMVEAIEFNNKFMGAMASFGKGMAGFGKGETVVAAQPATPAPATPAPAVAAPVRSIQFRQPVPVSSWVSNTWVNPIYQPIYQTYLVGLAPYY